jgi:hypothetical protein
MSETPYEPPKSAPPDARQFGRDRNRGCWIGFFSGGCLTPLILVGIAIAYGALPLLWFVLVIPVGIFGGMIGGIIGAVFAPQRQEEDHRRFGKTLPKDR